MKTLIQRVCFAQVTVDDHVVGRIGPGLLLFVGIDKHDTAADVDLHVQKVLNLRVFADEAGKMNRSVMDVAGEILVVSQFTLSGNCKNGTRPSFDTAMSPGPAKALFETYVETLKAQAPMKIETGQFGAMMQVALENDGPVTFLLDLAATV